MIVVLERSVREQDKLHVREFLEAKGYRVREIEGEEETILGAVGIVSLDVREVEVLPGVARVIPITKPYKLASREMRKDDTVIPVGPVRIGGLRIVVMAGPCAVESREQILETARLVRDCGAVILRAGAFKPRTSPYAFQGLGEEGLSMLKAAGEATGMPVVSEIVATEHASMMRDYVDILQIGARNMQNFELLKRVGGLGKPVLLKRGFAATIQDLLMSAEYVLAHGCDQVILCERGIRTFETYTRNTLDISAIPVVKQLSHLPIIVDPSHGTGLRGKVAPMALAAVAAGADGLEVEVHPDPDKALSDGPQSLYPEQFEKLMRDIEAMAPVLGKEMARLPAAARAGRPAVVELRERAAAQAEGSGTTAGAASGAAVAVAFQGERGAFSEQAARRWFAEEAGPIPLPEFRDVFEAVLRAEAAFGIVPVENSLTGSIHQNYDLLLQYPDLRIVGEQKIRIVHNLIGFPQTAPEAVRRVYSHPQGLAQCARFLDAHPEWERVTWSDTAGAVRHVAEKGLAENAAIASEEAARVYGLAVLKAGIETDVQNYTRFVVIARDEPGDRVRDRVDGRVRDRVDGRVRNRGAVEQAAALMAEPPVPARGPRKASFCFAVADKPGSLFRGLSALSERGVNMKKLESRPIAGKPWQYMFYVDVEVPEDADVFLRAVGDLAAVTEDLRVLGIY